MKNGDEIIKVREEDTDSMFELSYCNALVDTYFGLNLGKVSSENDLIKS